MDGVIDFDPFKAQRDADEKLKEQFNQHAKSVSVPGYGAWDLGEVLTPSRYIVKGVLNEAESMIVFGQSQSMKSFVTLDMMMHIAMGWDWQGHKVQQSAGLIVLGEGMGAYRKRVFAWLKYHKLLGLPKDQQPWLWIAPRALDLTDSHDQLRVWIEQAQDHIGQPIKATLIDTLSTNMGKNAKENDTNSMAALITNTNEAVQQASGGTGSNIFVHHSGHGNDDRERGSSTLMANVDNRIKVSRPEMGPTIQVENMKNKDGELFKPVYLDWHVVPVGVDQDGDEVTSLVLLGGEKPVERQEGKKLPTGAATVLELIKAHGGRMSRRELLAAMKNIGQSNHNLSRDIAKLVSLGLLHDANPMGSYILREEQKPDEEFL